MCLAPNVEINLMQKNIELTLDWATHEAAKYACEKWHYSKCMPSGKTVKIGVWENGQFKGVVVFGLGANAEISKMYGKTAELARIALTKHETPVTRIVSIALKMLKKYNLELEAVISYADLDRHEGKIYKAGNWKEEGVVKNPWVVIHGKKMHPRTVFARYGTRSISWLKNHIDSNARYISEHVQIVT